MAFSDDVTENSKGINASVKTAVNAAFNTFHTSLNTEFTTYGLNAKDKEEVDVKLIDLLRYLSAALR